MRRKIAAIVTAIMLLNIFMAIVPDAHSRVYAASHGIEYYKSLPESSPYHIPDSVPNTSISGKPFNEKWWIDDRYRVIVYGSEKDWPKTRQYYAPNLETGTMEYRYLGYDYMDNPFSNQRFPNDVNTGLHPSEMNWIPEPWNVLGFEPTKYSREELYAPDINRMVQDQGWTPNNSGTFFGYGNVQSYPTLAAKGSMRMWHRDKVNGVYQTLYQTFPIPEKPTKEEVPFSVTTEILSDDFTIGEDESTVDIVVKVTAHLHDESVYNDPYKNVLYYNRADVDRWYIKLEYKDLKGDSAPYVTIKANGSNTASNTFTVKLKRDDVVNGERVYFNGIGRVVFKNEKSLVANDTKNLVLTVLNKPNPVYPPDIFINAPAQANVNESYQVEVAYYVPSGETMQSLVLEKSFNGEAYTPLPLTNNKATESYPSEGTVSYRATITLTNGKSATASAATQIADNRAASAKADIWLPVKETFEGHYISALNKNRFTFEGQTYTAIQARELGIGTSTFGIYDKSKYELESSLYDIRNRDNDKSMEVRFNAPGSYKLGCIARPINGEEDEDVEAVLVKPCPFIVANLYGVRKDDRKLTLDFSGTITNPDYPLDNSKTYVVIEDMDTGEKATVRYGLDPDTATIKTKNLLDNKLDFLIKASSDRHFKATIYVEDVRGKSDTWETDFTVKPDLPPVADIKTALVQYRDNTSVSTIRIGKAGYSNDGDKIILHDMKIKVDANNNGSFSEESFVDVSNPQPYDCLTGQDYMQSVVNWRDINSWDISYPSGSGSITWDSSKDAWKITGCVYMYLKVPLAASIDTNNSYNIEVTVMRENDQGKTFYWGGDRLNSSKVHLSGFGGTYDYSAATAVLPPVGKWITYKKVGKTGTASSYDGWGTDGCKYYRIGGLVNYSGSNTQVTYVKDIKFYFTNDNGKKVIVKSNTDNELVITTNRVGKILVDYTVKEDLTPETIPSFVTDSDYLTAGKTSVIDVDNLAPHTSLRTIGSSKVDLMFAIKQGDRAQYDARIGSLQSGLNQVQPVSLDVDSINEMDISAISGLSRTVHFYDFQDYFEIPYPNAEYKDFRTIGATDKTFITRINGIYYGRSFETGRIVYKIDSGLGVNKNITDFFVTGTYLIVKRKIENSDYFSVFDADTGSWFLDAPISYGSEYKFYTYGDYIIPLLVDSNKNLKPTPNTLVINLKNRSYRISSLPNDTILGVKDNYVYMMSLVRNISSQTFGYEIKRMDIVTDNISTVKTDVRYESPYVSSSESYTWQGIYWLGIPRILSNGSIVIDYCLFVYASKYHQYCRCYRVHLDSQLQEKIRMSADYEDGYINSTSDRIQREEFIGVTDNYIIGRYCSDHFGHYLYLYNKSNWGVAKTINIRNGRDYYRIEESQPNYQLLDSSKKFFGLYHYDNYSGKDDYYAVAAYDASGTSVVRKNISSSDTKEAGIVNMAEDSPVRAGFKHPDWWYGQERSVSSFHFYDTVTGNYASKNGGTWYDNNDSLKGFYKDGKAYLLTETGYLVYDPITNIIDTTNYDTNKVYAHVWAISSDKKYVGGYFNWPSDGNEVSVLKFSDTVKILQKYAENFTARPNTQPYAVVIYDGDLTGTSQSDIDTAVNALNAKGLKCIWLGKSANQAVGQAIASGTGGTFMLYADYNDAFTKLQNYIASQLPPIKSKYVVNVKKGEPVSYEKYYFDLEGDSQIPSTTRWMYRHIPTTDGKASFSDQWLSSPVTAFDKNGTYYVSWDVQDNPKPADADSRFSSYRKYAVREEMTIVVGDAEPPAVQTVNPILSIQIGGSLKKNRKVTAGLFVTAGTNDIDYSKTVWTYTALSGGTASDIKKKDISVTSKQLLFKKAGRYRIAAAIEDVKGNKYSTQADIDIVDDLPVAGSLYVVPEVTYRNQDGEAFTHICLQAASTDDYIEYIRYYLAYDSDNDGDFADEAKTELTDFQNTNMFDIGVTNGVGSYRVYAEIKEGFKEDTIPEFITDADYSRLNLEGNFTVDNIEPYYSIKPGKDVYLVGEIVKYYSDDFTELKGDPTKGYRDTEKDPMSDFSVKYTQDKTAMASQDSTSVYHNITSDSLVESFDRAGMYTIEASAYDDPKDGDSRFAGFKIEADKSISSIIVHRRPKAQASFTASHPSETVFDFGNNMYLEGTQLRVMDGSYDPDGFAVSTTLDYKVGNGEPVIINSGDTFTLEYNPAYGNNVTVRVETEDNWGATDSNLYNIIVINDLDMAPEVIPSPVPASETVTLRLTTNQYATSARAFVFGQDIPLTLVSEAAGQKVWEARYTIPAAKPDSTYTAQFYAVSEGLVELRKDKDFTVDTPISLVPYMPSEVTAGQTIRVQAAASKYANSVKAALFKGTVYETVLNLAGTLNGEIKNWSVDYTIPDTIIEGTYEAEFTARTPNGNVEVKGVNFEVSALRITGVSIQGCWNHWRGQVDMFGRQMSVEPHRFLSLERVKIDVETSGFAEKIVIRFSPELEAMSYTNKLNQTYDYRDDFFGYYVNFPGDSTITAEEPKAFGSFHWEYNLPLAPSSKAWDDVRRREPYKITVYAYRDDNCAVYEIDDIDITGNVYDLTYIQPIN